MKRLMGRYQLVQPAGLSVELLAQASVIGVEQSARNFRWGNRRRFAASRRPEARSEWSIDGAHVSTAQELVKNGQVVIVRILPLEAEGLKRR